MKREIEIFAEQTIKNGGTWATIAETRDYIMVKSQSWFMVKGHLYGDTPVFQLFDKWTGKRLQASTSSDVIYTAMARR